MLPEEQLYKILRNKQAGILFGNDDASGLYFQQGNLGGNTFKDDENPLQALLGQEFVDKYGQDYADTLNDTWFSGKGRLTSRTGARLMQDLNKMDARGIAALKGLADNPEKAIQFIQEINNSKVGVNGYTKAQAIADTEETAKQLNMLARMRKGPDAGLFNITAKNFVRGKFTNSIDELKRSMAKTPWYASPFVTDVSDEFENDAFIRRVNGKNIPSKLIATSRSGNVDESDFTGKTDKLQAGGFFGQLRASMNKLLPQLKEQFGATGQYLLPALLLGAIGGGVNKLRGGSFLAPLLLMTLLGGFYGYSRNKGWFGGDKTSFAKTIDKMNELTNNTSKSLYEKGKKLVSPYISNSKDDSDSEGDVVEATPFATKSSNFKKFANYKNTTIIDFIR